MQAPRSPLPPELAIGPFSVALGREFGLSRGRMRSADLEAPFRGVRRLRHSDITLVELCRAYAARMPGHHFFSHATAARLLGAPLPLRLSAEPRLHVCTVYPRRPPQMHGVIGHHVRPRYARTMLVQDLPVASPLLMLRQVSAVLTLGEVVAVGDFLLGGREPLATLDQLLLLDRAPRGQRGAARLREALPLMRERVDSPMETELRLLIVDAGFPEPVVNFEIRIAERRRRLDLAYPELKLALEYEGDLHRTDLQTFRNDIRRREELEDAGWRVIRVVADDLTVHRGALLARLRRAIDQRGR